MKCAFLLAICALLLMTGFVNHPSKKNDQNIAVSANKRFLTVEGRPFFWLGDTGWLLLSKLSRDEIEKYFDDRKAKGFNVIQIMLLHTLSAVNIYGDSALINKNIATPYFPSTGSQNNNQKYGYWENLDFVIDLAAKKGLYLALVPVWGSNVKAGHVSEKQAEVYATFLAERYKNKTNLVWMNGGDVRGSDSIMIWNIIGNTLKKHDPNHLITYHPFGRCQSSKWFHNETWLDFNIFQSGHRRYDQDTSRTDLRYGEDNWRYVISDYNKIPVKPTFDGEPPYEGIPQGLHDTLQPRWTDNDVRRYAYWSVFSGACGFTYGNNSVMQMHKKEDITSSYGAKGSWIQALNAPGACQMGYLKKLMLKYHFEELVPDQSPLTEVGERYNHLGVLKGKTCLLVYTYNGRTFSLNPSQLKGDKFKVRWYCPRNGQFIDADNFKKAGLQEFNPPGIQEDGNDWVLILENI